MRARLFYRCRKLLVWIQRGAIHQHASSKRHGLSVLVHQSDVCSHAIGESGWTREALQTIRYRNNVLR